MLGLFKEKEPEQITNHVTRTIIEAKYTIQDLTLAEVQLLRSGLQQLTANRYIYSLSAPKNITDLLAKIQL